MPSVTCRDRPTIPSPRAISVLLAVLALLLVAGCGSRAGGDSAQVDVKQQKELNKLLTQDYGQMYREKYQKQSKTRKAK